LSHKAPEERAKENFDHPDSLDTELMVSHIQNLKNGVAIDVPTYCFHTHSRKTEVRHETPKRIIIVEGILIFTDPALRNELDILVFVVSAKIVVCLDMYYNSHEPLRTRIRMCASRDVLCETRMSAGELRQQ
jgi:uridine kinase